jgi:hypothetical protein
MTMMPTQRGPIGPGLLAAIRPRRAALATAPPAPARVARLAVVAATPTPASAPKPEPPPPRDPFSAAAAAALYAERQQVTRQAGVDRVRALGGEPVPSGDAPRPPAARRDAEPAWPDPAEVYARRREDVRRAQLQRIRVRG